MFELALTSLDVLTPDMGRSYTKFGLTFQAQSPLAKWTNNNEVVVNGIAVATGALVIIWPSMIGTVDAIAKFTFERQEILLRAMSHGAVPSYVCEFHFKFYINKINKISLILS